MTRLFSIIWLGQLVSLLGSGLTAFAMGLWILDHTRSATQFSFVLVLGGLPVVLLAPLAGSVIDRSDRRRILLLSESGAALCPLSLALLLHFGQLAVWHVYLVVFLNAVCNTFQWPALLASITVMVPKSQYGRASGMLEVASATTGIAAPGLAGLLLTFLDLWRLLIIDFASFSAAILALLLVRFPPTPGEPRASGERLSLWQDFRFGLQFLRQRPALLSLLLLIACVNLMLGMAQVGILPLVRSFAGPAGAGTVVSVCGIGTLLGGTWMAVTGGPRPRIYGVLGGVAGMTLGLLVMSLRPAVGIVAAGSALLFGMLPVINGSSQAIWQSKVPPALQGRVFATRRMINQSTLPLGSLLIGPLIDHVFQPLMAEDGGWAGIVSRLLGGGPGRGIALMYALLALVPLSLSLRGFSNAGLRHIERALPDALAENSGQD